jgi:hypothetical protein
MVELGSNKPQGVRLTRPTWRGHAGSATDVDHFPLSWFDMEIAEGTNGRDNVAGFEAKDVTGTTPGAQSWPGGGVAMRTLKPFGLGESSLHSQARVPPSETVVELRRRLREDV